MTDSPFTFFSFKEFFPNCTKAEIDTVLNSRTFTKYLFMIAYNIDCIRLQCDFPIRITSGFRSLSHNMLAGGSSTSQHLLMQAIDVQPLDKNPEKLQRIIEEVKKPLHTPYGFGQVIIYPTFVHLALPNKKYQMLTISHSK